MKSSCFHFFALLAALILSGCGSTQKTRQSPPAAAASGKAVADSRPVAAVSGKAVTAPADFEDELDEYSAQQVADPLEPLNRVTFAINHEVYRFVLRPISKGYEFIVPKPVRQGLFNAFDNIRFPIRVVNHSLQGRFDRTSQETGKFLVNSVAGVGGLWRVSDKIPAIADVPAADTGQTFAKWGIGNGFYFVIPVLGPTTLRDGVGLAGDYLLHPLTWVSFVFGDAAYLIAIPITNTVRSLPGQMGQYDAATENALDRYLAVRSGYVQYRKEAASR